VTGDMLTTDAYGNPYEILDFTDVDCRVLQDAVAARTPNIRLSSIRLATGQLAITVMARVSARSLVDFGPPIVPQWEIVSYIARSVHGWQIHHPERGPEMEFNTAQQVADFLALDPGFSEGWSDAWNKWMLANGKRFVSE
jgi:hypothetical protein